MAELFDVVGEDFFKPFTSLFKYIYVDCLSIRIIPRSLLKMIKAV